MPSLPDTNFHKRGKNGDVLRFTSKVSVDSHGIFAVTIPDELEHTAMAMRKRDDLVTVGRPKKYLRVEGSTLETCYKKIADIMNTYLDCTVTEELVIRYSINTDYSVFRNEDGSLHPCGSYGNYDEDGSTWVGNLHATKRAEHFTIGVYARVFKKITHSRGGIDRVEYEYERELASDTHGDRLNAFVGMDGPHRGGNLEEIPYTEEAARFFHDTVMGVLAMAHNVRTFFDDKSNLIKAIESNELNILAAPPVKGLKL